MSEALFLNRLVLSSYSFYICHALHACNHHHHILVTNIKKNTEEITR